VGQFQRSVNLLVSVRDTVWHSADPSDACQHFSQVDASTTRRLAKGWGFRFVFAGDLMAAGLVRTAESGKGHFHFRLAFGIPKTF
jgi:hypothetical protein